MRVALLYPPPQRPSGDGARDGPAAVPADAEDSDARLTPYGLLSLAAQAIRTGHQVKVLNLYTYAWAQVEEVIRALPAGIYGLSCFTSNRVGVSAAAELVRRHHPSAHITVGGPHVTALPAETLCHWPAVDTVVIGEGEETFLELLGRLAAGLPATDLAGTAWREGATIRIGPPRTRIADLDSLAAPHEHFPYNVVLTSRGCPGQCTFCASAATWGRRLTFHSPAYVLDAVEKALARLPAPTLMFKDDTFTANRRRAMEICQGILDRRLNFLWSCDSRADALDEELLALMRRAGCQLLSLGVESGSPAILQTIRKRIEPRWVLETTELARKYGLAVRYYMIAGNRGETAETFRQSVDFLKQARPSQYVFSILSIFPGTEEFEVLRRQGKLSTDDFFRQDFVEYWVPPAEPILRELLADHCGRKFANPTVEECRAVLGRLGDLHAAHLDLGAACLRAGRLDEAERHIRRALDLGYPLPALAHNYLAGIAGRRGDLPAMKRCLQTAVAGTCPHPLAAGNALAFNEWARAGGQRGGRELHLAMHHDFQAVTPSCQPISPGPLPADYAQWPSSPVPLER